MSEAMICQGGPHFNAFSHTLKRDGGDEMACKSWGSIQLGSTKETLSR